MKKYRGGYQICKALGFGFADYTKVTTFLNLINAPMEINERGVKTYCLTEAQVWFLKNELEKIKKEIIDNKKTRWDVEAHI